MISDVNFQKTLGMVIDFRACVFSIKKLRCIFLVIFFSFVDDGLDGFCVMREAQ